MIRTEKVKPPLITLTIPELGGGLGRNLCNLGNGFVAHGFRVHLLTDTLKGSLFQFLDKNIEIFKLRTSHAIGGIPGFSAYLLRYRPEVVMTPVVRHTILALRSKGVTGVDTKIFARIHNTYSKTFNLLKSGKSAKRIKLIRKYYPRCEKVFAVSKGAAEDFCELTGIPPNHVIAIHNPLDIDWISSLANQDIDHPWFEATVPPVILGAGRLTLAKNFPVLIRAFEIVRSETPCRLVILGDGPQRRALETLVAASPYHLDISLAGHKINPFSFMRHSAIFVLSSSWEGFPNVLLEAMAAGTPVVSTNCPSGPEEILSEGKFGPLVPVDDASSLAKAILDIMRKPTPPELLLEGVRRFEFTTVAAKFLEIFGLPPYRGTG